MIRATQASTPARLFVASMLLLLGACDKNDGESTSLTTASWSGIYAGLFPCDGCPGIDATLWLRADGRFFFAQRYPAEKDREALSAYSFGRWDSSDDEHKITLHGAGPPRLFERDDTDTLFMRTPSHLEHRLARGNARRPFSETVRMSGTARRNGEGYIFTECLTDYSLPLSKSGDFSRFRHQFRSIEGRDAQAYVELEGHFSWSNTGAPTRITVDRFVTARADKRC